MITTKARLSLEEKNVDYWIWNLLKLKLGKFFIGLLGEMI